MRHREMGAGARRGIILGVMSSFAMLFSAAGGALGPPAGLPDSPELPDLYDPAIVSTYTVVAKRPYQVNGHQLATWLMATVLTPPAAHVGPPSVEETKNAFGPTGDVVLVIGYVTDTRDGRIIALSETFTHPSNGTRSIRAWVDEGWARQGKASGEWGPPIRTDKPLSPPQTAAFMEQMYRLVDTGFQHTLKR